MGCNGTLKRGTILEDPFSNQRSFLCLLLVLSLPPPSKKSNAEFPRLTLLSLAVLAASLPLSQASAADVTVDAGEVEYDIIETGASDTVSIYGKVDNEKIKVDGSTFNAYEGSSITTEIFDLYAGNVNNMTFKADLITANQYFVYRGGPGNMFGQKLTSEVKTPWLAIVGTATETGFEIADQKVIAGVQNFWMQSNGSKTRISVAGDLDFTGKTLHFKDTAGSHDAGVEIKNDGSLVKFSDIYLEGGKGILQINNSGAASVENLYVAADSRMNLQTWSDQTGASAKFSLANANIAENGTLRLSVYGTFSPATITGDLVTNEMTLNLEKGAGVDFGGWKEDSQNDWRPDKITVAMSQLTVNIADSSSSNYVYLSKPGLEAQGALKAENILVVAAGSNNTGNAAADLEKLVEVVQTNYKDKDLNNHLECLPGVVLEQEANDIFDGAVGEVGPGTIDPATGDCVDCGVQNVRTIDNPNVHGIAEMTALGLHIWRNEIDDMHRRMGDLRDSSGQANGLWTRIYNGKASFGGQSIENKYTAFQFGYDHQVSPGLWLGGALSYTYGDNDFDHGEGDSNLLAFTAYASRLFENGFYLDFTGKVGRMKNSFDIRVGDIRSSGDYHTNAVSVSAEAGWRFDVMKNVFFEPQVEVWYGHVFDAQYETSTGVDVDQASTDSLVGRAGFRLGLECPNNRGSAFIKASVLHDWEGEADFRFSKGGVASRTLTEDLGGTWYEYGIGADFNATEQLHFWAELERGDGGEVDTDYRATIGMRYAW